jgi:hypothetical protein
MLAGVLLFLHVCLVEVQGLEIEPTFDTRAMTGMQSQLITDDLVESLTEIGSFFMPKGMVVAPIDYVNDNRRSLALQGSELLVEISSQQIFECQDRLSIRLSGAIIEGFERPREFSFFLSHSYVDAKVFRGRDTLQTFELSEFLRLKYPPIPLVLTDTLFSLHFLDFSNGDEPNAIFNGGGCLLLGEEFN